MDVKPPDKPKHQDSNQRPQVVNNITVNQPTPKQMGVLERDWLTALLLSIFLGWFGIDAFYLGKTAKGLVKLFTLGLFGILWFIDVIMIATKSVNNIVWKEDNMSDKTGNNKGNWFGRHKVLTVIGAIIVLIIIVVIANGGGSKTNVNTTASTTSSKSSSSSSSKAAATVGSTVNVGGSSGLAVTLNQVIDPATGADYSTPDAGDRYIAVDLKIVNNGKASFTDDANNDTTLIGTDNQTYTADFDDVSECTNFNDGQYTLTTGQSTTGCVVFQVPDAVNTAKVEFQIQSGLNNETGEWTVN